MDVSEEQHHRDRGKQTSYRLTVSQTKPMRGEKNEMPPDFLVLAITDLRSSRVREVSIPPSTRPPTPTIATLPPPITRPCGTISLYTSPQLLPGPMVTVDRSFATETWLRSERSMVTPFSMFAASAKGVCLDSISNFVRRVILEPGSSCVTTHPPPRTAKLHRPGTNFSPTVKIATASATSFAPVGRKMHRGETSCSWIDQYEFNDCSYPALSAVKVLRGRRRRRSGHYHRSHRQLTGAPYALRRSWVGC